MNIINVDVSFFRYTINIFFGGHYSTYSLFLMCKRPNSRSESQICSEIPKSYPHDIIYN